LQRFEALASAAIFAAIMATHCLKRGHYSFANPPRISPKALAQLLSHQWISFTPSREGSDWIQRELLLAEGIAVDGEGRLPLGRYLWIPPLEDALDG
jgi:hypothetical protein